MPCASNSRVIVKRDRSPSSIGSIAPLATAINGSPTPRTVQVRGASSSVISSVLDSFRGPACRMTVALDPAKRGRRLPGEPK
jgi:hypothetical protein